MTGQYEARSGGTRSTQLDEAARVDAAQDDDGFLRDPRRVRQLGVLIVLVLSLLSGLLAYGYNRTRPAAYVTSPASSDALFSLQLPPALSGYTRESVAGEPSASADGTTTVTARYAKDDRTAVVVLLSRPATDPATFLQVAGFDSIVPDATDGACGTSTDADGNGCAVIRHRTAILTVGLLGQDRSDLLALTRQFAASVAG